MSIWSKEDSTFMAQAIRLAERGLYTTDPNPRVGCVLVNDGSVVGKGFHVRAGEPHAEVYALNEAGEKAKGATAYVTLEPCSHFGRTPPCAEGLINAGVTRVVAAMQDPNPLVAGRGLQMLADAGVEVESGLLEVQARALNPGFIKRMECGRPFVRLKMAMSLDGRTAMQSGESQWITGASARQDVQRLRGRSSAIITGIGSVQLDDPALTVRTLIDEQAEASHYRQPIRCVLDATGKMSATANILKQPGRTLWFTQGERSMPGAEVISAEVLDGKIDLSWLLTFLAETEQCNEVLVETGAQLAGSFIEQNLVDELIVYMAPTLLGSSARPLLNLPLHNMQQQKRLHLLDVRQLGEDCRFTYRFSTEAA